MQGAYTSHSYHIRNKKSSPGICLKEIRDNQMVKQKGSPAVNAGCPERSGHLFRKAVYFFKFFFISSAFFTTLASTACSFSRKTASAFFISLAAATLPFSKCLETSS